MSRWGKVLFFVALVAFALMVAVRYLLGGWTEILYIPLLIGMGALMAGAILELRFFLDFFTMRTTKHGMNMGTMILLAVAGLVAVNILAVRKNKVWDVTEDKIFSLSDQSLAIVKPLDKPMTVTIFYRGEKSRGDLNGLREALRLYQDASPQMKVEFYDTYVENEKAQDYLNTLPDKESEQNKLFVFVEYDGRRERVPMPFTETEVTSAMVKVTRKSNKKIYFLAGHGEHGLTSAGEDGLSHLKEQIELFAAKAETLSLVQTGEIPKDASAIIISGPKEPMTAIELDLLRSYLVEGGRLLVMGDPGEKHNLAAFLKTVGIEFSNTYIVNLGVQLQGASELTVPGLDFDQQSDITKTFVNGETFAIFHVATEVRKLAGADTQIAVQELVRTSPRTLSISELSAKAAKGEARAYVLGASAKGKLKDKEGKLSEKEFQLVAFGDSDFMTNKLLEVPTNLNLGLNTIASLSGEQDLISIRPKRPSNTKLLMTSAVWLGVVSGGVMLPTMLMILGSVIWFRRRSA
jgi:ABC-type uncharacterized transport system involved in gliding motility auxiliary subunit